MKKILVICLVALCCLFGYNMGNAESEITDLAFANIESLSQNEDSTDKLCLGYGSLDCENFKAAYIITGYK